MVLVWIIHFFFESIELAELSPDDLLAMEQPGLLPLLPLTKGGIRKEVTEQMFASLKASEQTDLLAIGGTLASLVFSREHSPDLEWLHRRLRAMHDILRESPYYQEILREGYQEGLEEGVLKGQRETLLAIIQFRFPKIARLAKKLVTANDDPASLQTLTVKISMAQTTEEAKRYLLEEDDENEN